MRDKLKLYLIDIKYVRNLSKADSHVMSVSPQTGKDTRPFVGIITLVNNKKYCIPFTSSNKEKFSGKKSSIDCIRIFDETQKDEKGAPISIGFLNVNNMIPVHSSVIYPIEIGIKENDSVKEKERKNYLAKQLDWCQKNHNVIIKKANKIYDLYINHPEKNIRLTRRCCNFKKLEEVLEKWIEKEIRKCNEVLEKNPQLKAKLNAAAAEYNKKHNLPPFDSSSTTEERYERRIKVFKANPELLAEYERTEKEYTNKPIQTQTKPTLPKHQR